MWYIQVSSSPHYQVSPREYTVDVIVHTPHANMKPLASDQTLLSVIAQYEL